MSIVGQTFLFPVSSAKDVFFSQKELICESFSYLSPREIIQCSRVSRRWLICSREESLWRVFFERVCPGRGELLKPRSFRKAFIHFYSNLRNGVYASRILQLTDNQEADFIIAEKGTLCVLGRRALKEVVHVYHLPSEVFKKSFVIHDRADYDNWVCILTIHKGILYIGFKKGEIQAWDLETEKCVGIFEGHQDEIGHNTAISNLAVIGQRLLSISCGGKAKTWDLKTKRCVDTIDTPKKTLATEGEILYSGFKNGKIAIDNLVTGFGSYLNGYEPYEGRPDLNQFEEIAGTRVRSLVSTGGILYAHSTHAGIRIWDLMTSASTRDSRKLDASIRPLRVIRDTDFRMRHNDPAIGQIATSGGTLYVLFLDHTVSSINKIIVRDFCASDETIFQELANLFKMCFSELAMTRFNRMSEPAKEGVYREVYFLIEKRYALSGGYEKNRDFCKHSFDKFSGAEKSLAIENYLKKP